VAVKSKADTVAFHPYYTVKDGFAVSLFLILFALFVFYLPDAFAKVDNAIPANPLVTPPHIVPEWYLLPFYAILRAIPDKLMGVLALGGAIGMLFILPWLDRSEVRSMRYRPRLRLYFFIWIIACLALGWCGSQEPDGQVIKGLVGPTLIDYDINTVTWLSRISAAYFFFYFLIATPFLSGKTLPTPSSIYTPVLSHPAATPAGAVAAAEKKG
jgi:ubiquinol-cytochrome c reductase cytochrome b subunit